MFNLRKWLGRNTNPQTRIAPTRSTAPRSRPLFTVTPLEDRTCPAVTFDFDYSYDTSSFFTADKKAAIAQAGAEVGKYLSTTLSAITPGGANTWSSVVLSPINDGLNIPIVNYTIGANTIKVFVGSQNITDPSTVAYSSPGSSTTATGSLDPQYRGNAAFVGTGYNSAWGGSLSIDNTFNWYTGTGTPASNEIDLRTIVRHELGHLLGFTSSGAFNGSYATFANGGTAPSLSGGGHWASSTTWDGQVALMAPGSSVPATRTTTGLDYAGLKDVGWTVAVAIGTPAADAISVVKLTGNTYRATITNSQGTRQYDFDGSSGILVLGGAGDDVVSVGDTAFAAETSVRGGSGSDTVSVTSSGPSAVYEQIGNSLLVAGQVNALVYVYEGNAVESLVVYGTGGNDSLTVRSLSAATVITFLGGSGNDTVNVAPGGTSAGFVQASTGTYLQIAGQAGALVYAYGSDPVENLILNGTSGDDYLIVESLFQSTVITFLGGTGTDTVSVADSSPVPIPYAPYVGYEQTGNYLQVAGRAGTLVYAYGSDAAEHLDLYGVDVPGDDYLTVRSLYAATVITFLGGSGNDTVNVAATSIQPPLWPFAAYEQTGNYLQAAGEAGTLVYAYGYGSASAENLVLYGTGGNDYLTVRSLVAPTVITFLGGAGTDTVNVAATSPVPIPYLPYVGYEQTGNYLQTAGYSGTLVYAYASDPAENLVLYGTSQNDYLTVRSVSTATTIWFHGQDGTDDINFVKPPGIAFYDQTSNSKRYWNPVTQVVYQPIIFYNVENFYES